VASEPAVLDHEYDGIREYDNPTPGWWQALFFISVALFWPYCSRYHLDSDATTIESEWADEQAAANKKLFAEIGELKADEPTILKLMGDTKWLGVAQSMFKGNCAACHGSSGQGGVGPNMTDDVYKNVKTLLDVPTVITSGANNGAMPAWKGRLSSNEIVLLSAYVASLRGQNLPGSAPDGQAAAPWPKVTPAPVAEPKK